MIKTRSAIVLGCGLLLALALAGTATAQDRDKSDARKLLVGKWLSSQKAGDKDLKVMVEFTDKGKVSVTVRDFKVDGTYKFLDDKTIETELVFEGESRKIKNEVTVTADTLELKDPKGMVSKFERAK
jgi:uncharacterized protein (TIGR03066 family)